MAGQTSILQWKEQNAAAKWAEKEEPERSEKWACVIAKTCQEVGVVGGGNQERLSEKPREHRRKSRLARLESPRRFSVIMRSTIIRSETRDRNEFQRGKKEKKRKEGDGTRCN